MHRLCLILLMLPFIACSKAPLEEQALANAKARECGSREIVAKLAVADQLMAEQDAMFALFRSYGIVKIKKHMNKQKTALLKDKKVRIVNIVTIHY